MSEPSERERWKNRGGPDAAIFDRGEQAGFERGVAHAEQSCGVSRPCLDLIEAAVQAERERWMSDPEARLYDGRAERDAEIKQHIEQMMDRPGVLTVGAEMAYRNLLAWIGEPTDG